MTYDPVNWYWLADDGRLFASGRQAIVADSDHTYQDWLTEGNFPSRWPVDDNNIQSNAALQWIFENAGVNIFVELNAYAASKRYAVETGGIIVNDMHVATDRASQSMITGAYNYAQANPGVMVQFKTAAGFLELTATQMTAIADAVGSHVQAAFATESSVAAAIQAGTISTFAEIDAASWPSND